MPGRVLELLGPSAGGIRRNVAALTDGLDQRGWSVRVAGPAGVMDGIGRLDVEVAVPTGLSPANLWAARQTLARVMPHADLVHAHGLKAGLLASTITATCPLVVTVHNLVLDEVAGRSAAVLRRLEGMLPRRADSVIAVSTEIAERFEGLPGAEKVTVIAPAARPPEVRRERAEVRRALGVPDDAPLVVTPARLSAQKDLPTLIRAIHQVRDRVPGLRAVVVGEGEERDALQQLIDELRIGDTMTLAGHVPNAADEMAAADLVALSSRWEGNPVTIGEALKLGKPVAATAVGDVPSLIEDGKTGRLVPPEDPGALAEAIHDLLADRATAQKMADEGQQRAEQLLGTDTLVGQVEDVYRHVLGAARQ